MTLESNSVRPTTDRVKEAIFSSIQFDIEGRRVLDLFAGSGQLGIEALSRGAKNAVFVDISPDAAEVIRKNISSTGFSDRAELVKKDWFSFVASANGKFDIAFLDPPYREGLLEDALLKVGLIMSDHGVIICEHPTDISLPDLAGEFSKTKTATYGKIAVSYYRKESE